MKRMGKWVLGLLVMVSLGRCKKLTEVEATGLVRDAANQAPLDSVVVSLYEDNDGAFMGSHLLQETVTDATGKFRFNFKYTEGPYKIYVNKANYRYYRVLSSPLLNSVTTVDYQEIPALEAEPYLVFDMAPQAFLTLKIKNVAPALPSDEIKVEVGRGLNSEYAFTRTFEGIVDTEFAVGNVDGNTYVPLRYSIRENNVWRTIKDSVAVQPHARVVYPVQY